MANISITIKTTAQVAGVKTITSALNDLLKELKEINAAAKTLGSTFASSSKGAASAIGSITSAANSASGAITAAGKNAGGAFGSAASAASGFAGAASNAGATAASSLSNVAGSVAGVNTAIEASKSPIQSYGHTWEAVSLSIAHNLTTMVMGKLNELAMALPNFAQQSVDTAASFEDLMQQFEATSGSGIAAAGLEIKNFEQLVLDVGAKLPITVLDAQKMMIDMAKGGLNVAGMFSDEIAGTAGTLESTINFMDAAFISPERAAEISAKSLAMWRDATNTLSEDTAQLTAMQDVLVKAANSSTTSVDELFLGMTNAAAAAKTSGISFDDFTGLLSYMVDGFANANTAGTSMRYLFNTIQPSTENARGAMRELGWLSINTSQAFNTLSTMGAEYGISLEDIGDNSEVLTRQLFDLGLRMGMTKSEAEKYVEQHEKSVFFNEKGSFLGVEHMIDQFGILSDMMKSGQNAKLMRLTKDIFGEEGKQSVMAIVAKGDREAYEQYIRTMEAANGVGATAAIVQQGYEFAVEQFMGTMEAASISLGNRLLPVMEQIVTIGGEVVGVFLGQDDSLERIQQAIPQVYAAANQLVGEAYQYIIDMAPKVGAALAGVLPLIVDQFRVMGGDIVTSMNIILPQWRAILGAMAGAVLVFAGPSVIGVVTKAIGAISTAFVAARGSAFAFLASLGPLLPLAIAVGVAAAVVASNWGALEKAFNDAGGGIGGASAAISTLGTIISTWIEQELPVLLLQLGDQAVLLWKWIEDAIAPTLQRFNRWWTTVVDWMGTQWPLWREQLVDWALALWKWIEGAIPDVLTQLGEWWNTLVAYLTLQLPVWGATLAGWALALWKWITDALPQTGNAITTWWNDLVATVNEKLPEWQIQFGVWRDELFQWIINSGPATLQAIDTWYQGLERWVIAELPTWQEQLKAWTGPLWKFIGDALTSISPELGKWFETLKGDVEKKLPGWVTTFFSWRQALSTWIQESWSNVGTATQGWWNTLSTKVSELYTEWGPKFVAWGQQLWQWIVNASSTVTAKLADWFTTIVRWTQMRPDELAVEFAKWAVEAYDWIKTASVQSLTDLGTWINDILDWIIEEAPKLRAKYHEWAREATVWILNSIDTMLQNLNTWFADLTGWIIREGPGFGLLWAEWTLKTWSWIALAGPAALGALGVFLNDLLNWGNTSQGAWSETIGKFGQAIVAIFGGGTQEETRREQNAWWNTITGFFATSYIEWQTQTIKYGESLIASITYATERWPQQWATFQQNMMNHVIGLGSLLNDATGGWAGHMVEWITASIDRMQDDIAYWGQSLIAFIVGILPSWAQTMLGFGNESHRWILEAVPDLLINVGLFWLALQTKVLDYLQSWIDQWAPFASGAVQWLRDAINPMNTEVGNLLTGARDALSSQESKQKIEDGVAPLSSVAAMWPTNATSQLNTNTRGMVTSAGNTLSQTQSIIDTRLASFTTAAETTFAATTLSAPAATMVNNAASSIVSSGAPLSASPTSTVSPYYAMRTSAANTFTATTLSTPAATMVNNAVTSTRTAASPFYAGYTNTVSVFGPMRTGAANTFSANTMEPGASAMVNRIGNSFRNQAPGYYGHVISSSMQQMGNSGVTKMEEEFVNADSVSNEALRAAVRAWRTVRTEFQRQINRLPVPGSGGIGTIGSIPPKSMAYQGALPTSPMVQGSSGGSVVNNYTTINFSPAYHGAGISQSSDVALARIMSKV